MTVWEHALVYVEVKPGAGHINWAGHWPDKRYKRPWLEVLAEVGAEGWQVVDSVTVRTHLGAVEGVLVTLKRSFDSANPASDT
jgi:hypothetical protein